MTMTMQSTVVYTFLAGVNMFFAVAGGIRGSDHWWETALHAGMVGFVAGIVLTTIFATRMKSRERG